MRCTFATWREFVNGRADSHEYDLPMSVPMNEDLTNPADRNEAAIFELGVIAHYAKTIIDLSASEWRDLPNYSGSVPTGVRVGKCWRCAFVYSEQDMHHRWALRFYFIPGTITAGAKSPPVKIGAIPIHVETPRETQVRRMLATDRGFLSWASAEASIPPIPDPACTCRPRLVNGKSVPCRVHAPARDVQGLACTCVYPPDYDADTCPAHPYPIPHLPHVRPLDII